MDFSAVNWLAVVAAAIVAWLFGAAWYMGLSKPWLKAAKLDPATIKKSSLPSSSASSPNWSWPP